jgi:hypothetical protein
MTGSLETECLSNLKDREKSDQSSILEYSDSSPTHIGVVSSPGKHMVECADEILEELGMPEWALNKFLARRAGYQRNSAVDDAHEQAYEDAELGPIYRNHLQESEAAEKKIEEIVERILSGEDIVLVFYEEDDQKCHRHYLKEKIEQQLKTERSDFNLRA